MLVITVAETSERHGLFEVRLGRRVLCRSRVPLLAAARILLSEGADPSELIGMRHEGHEDIALRARIGAAAKLRVNDNTSDGKPRFIPWDAPPSARPRPPMRSEDGVAMGQPGAGQTHGRAERTH